MRVLVVFGTRPELIKLAPVVRALRAASDAFDVRVCLTAQHRDLLDPLLTLFDIRPDHDLDVMRAAQTPADVIARVLAGLTPLVDGSLAPGAPDWLVVQGDTTTAMTAALAAHYHGVRVAHVEAGLRTGRLGEPFPEEANRRIVGALASLHFAPTSTALEHLLREGVSADGIEITGNTGIDALRWAIEQPPTELSRLLAMAAGRLILVTAHRRESFGRPLEQICRAIQAIAELHPEMRVVYPVHPNPEVDGPVRRHLSHVPRVLLTPPLDYLTFVHVMHRAWLVLTDSGGVQEEAPSLGTPVLVLRDVTERPEGVAAGTARVVGTDPNRIVAEVRRLVEDPGEYARMARAVNPYGDGHAADRIVERLRRTNGAS